MGGVGERRGGGEEGVGEKGHMPYRMTTDPRHGSVCQVSSLLDRAVRDTQEDGGLDVGQALLIVRVRPVVFIFDFYRHD
jgi:hypothetical protein